MSVDYLAVETLNLFCWGLFVCVGFGCFVLVFFLLGGGSGLIGDFGGVKGSRWGCDFSFVCLYFLQ